MEPVLPSSGSKDKEAMTKKHNACFLLHFLFDPQDWCIMFLRNVDQLVSERGVTAQETVPTMNSLVHADNGCL
jgi:hypothetical protein